jgi:hypothetical protein
MRQKLRDPRALLPLDNPITLFPGKTGGPHAPPSPRFSVSVHSEQDDLQQFRITIIYFTKAARGC